MYTAALRMAYLGDGISSDYSDYPATEEEVHEEGEIDEPPPVPREDIEGGEELEENE